MRWGPALRVAASGARSQVSTGLVLLVAIGAATTTLSVALAVRSAALAPWSAAAERTHAGHVVVEGVVDEVARLASAPEVVESSGPWPLVFVTARHDDRDLLLKLVGRDSLDAAVERPALVDGTPDLSGLVLERSLADGLALTVGDRLQVGDRSLVVTGVAVSVAQPPFPRTVPGVAWTSTATVDDLGQSAVLAGAQVHLRLSDPDAAEAFARSHRAPPASLGGRGAGPAITTWQETRDTSLSEVLTTRAVLLSVSGILLLLTCAAVVLVVRARTTTDARRIGALKAAGFTPGEVVVVLLTPHAVVAGVAIGVGLASGGLLAPILSGRVASAVGSTSVPPLTWERAAATAIAGLAVIAVATAPALHGVAGTTVRALAPPVRRPRSQDVVGAVAQVLRLPLPAVLAARSVGRHPSRSLLTALSTGLAAVTVVCVLSMEATFDREARADRGPAPPGLDGTFLAEADAAADARLRTLVLVCSVVLLAVSAATVWGVSHFDARQGRVTGARLRAVGLTRRQAAGRLVVTQVLASAPGAVVGVPAGLLVFSVAYADANGSSAGAALPGAAALAVTGVLVLMGVAAIAAGPAARSLRGPVGSRLVAD